MIDRAGLQAPAPFMRHSACRFEQEQAAGRIFKAGSPTEAVADDPAVLLLDRAALLTVARRGGTLIRPAGSGFQAEPLPAAEIDE